MIRDPRGGGHSPGAVPPQRERYRRGDEQAAAGRERRRDVDVPTDDREGGGQLGERRGELVGILRAVERAAGGPGDLHERAIVGVERVALPAGPAAEPEAHAAEPAELCGAARERRGVIGAVADREDAHAPAGGLLRRGLRVDPPVVRAVGEHDDHVVGVAGAAVAGDGRAGRRDRPVDLGDGVERGQNALADGGAERGSEATERAEQLLGVRGGRDEDDGGAREGDEADARAARLGLDESGGRLLGGGDPVRLYVRGAHGARDVQGEHNRRGRRRDWHGRLRAGGTDRKHGKTKRQQRCGDAPPPARAARHGGPDERDRGHPDHGAPAPAPCQPPGGEHQRNDEEREQRPRPGEGHSDHPARTGYGEHGARGEQREG